MLVGLQDGAGLSPGVLSLVPGMVPWNRSLASRHLFPISCRGSSFQEVSTECLLCAKRHVEPCKFKSKSDAPQKGNSRATEAKENRAGKEVT